MANGKSVPQLTRMAGQRMNLKFNGQNELQQLVSTGGVEVNRKLGDDPEEITASRELVAKFDKNGEWSTIDQTGDVHFHDAAYAGQGDKAHVDRASNVVTIDGSVFFADASMQTSAQSASFSQAANTLRADGHVMSTDLRPSTAGISNLAPQPATISADHLVADTTRGHAIYSGKARMWQGESVIEAETIELDRPTQILHGERPRARSVSRRPRGILTRTSRPLERQARLLTARSPPCPWLAKPAATKGAHLARSWAMFAAIC